VNLIHKSVGRNFLQKLTFCRGLCHTAAMKKFETAVTGGVAALALIAVETWHLTHWEIEPGLRTTFIVRKEAHTEHQEYRAPEKPSYTAVQSDGGVVIRPPTATTTMTAYAPVIN
jgi:hypothetical protein